MGSCEARLAQFGTATGAGGVTTLHTAAPSISCALLSRLSPGSQLPFLLLLPGIILWCLRIVGRDLKRDMLCTFVETSRVKGRVFWGSSHCRRVGWEIRPQSDSLRIGPCNLRFAPVLVPNTDVREHVLRKGLRDIAPAPSLGN